MGAAGHYIQLAFIFGRTIFKVELVDGAPTGSLGLVKKAWMTGALFFESS